jgi:hypothetical protein
VRRLLTLLVPAALILGLAGCGGDDEDPAQAWADQVCGSIVDYRDTVQQIASGFQSDPSSVNADSLRSAVNQVGDATSELVDSVKAAGPPDTEAGRQAQSALEGLSDRTQQAIDQAKQATEADTSGLPALVTQLTTIAGQVGAIVTDVSTTFQQVASLDGGQELQDGFQQAESCQELRGESSG